MEARNRKFRMPQSHQKRVFEHIKMFQSIDSVVARAVPVRVLAVLCPKNCNSKVQKPKPVGKT